MIEPKISKGLQHIEDDLIAEAMGDCSIKSASPQKAWKRWVSVAAAIGLIAAGGLYFAGNAIYRGNVVNGHDEWWRDVVFIDTVIPISEREEGYIIYEMISEGNIYNGDILGKLYENSRLQRSCWPKFSHSTRVSFSRIPDLLDTDKNRYREAVSYIGDEKFCSDLLEVTEDYGSGDELGCYLIQNGFHKENVAVALQVYLDRLGESSFKLIMSEDFARVENADISKEIEGIKNMDFEGVSVINNKKICVKFVYSRKNIENQETEESYTYYAYWRTDDMEYLLQFDPGYTKVDPSSEVQKYRRDFFEDILVRVIELTE